MAIAAYFPISRNVHQVRCIISRNGDAERGEWITTQPFIHSIRHTTPEQIHELDTNLQLLAELQPWGNADQHDEDAIEPIRRSIRFWHNEREIMAYLPRRSLWTPLGTTVSGVAAFDGAWRSVWACAGSQSDHDLSDPNGQPD
ncbi:hypothetical protein [Rhodopirellula sp. P2]|uniref:hypothetical protein n=1 Tax=Rhodopirellula sp. P2 TaxID=2127060 RepID=UPI0023683EC4|nr:hypothetical protein [Rhodopirellula sp. P2]WDQ18626.1 hypothetical protein PSR62_08795 [Rhodopirellula sp. P2]WDQ19132.1 hypothetical protein PSR62_11455 [Rhodopirellula sp. P2]